MKLGLQLGYDDPIGGVAMAQQADRLGFHSVWTSEAWGADAVTMASWIAATHGADRDRHRDHADAGAHARDDRDDGRDARPALRRPRPARPRHLRAAGGRGLARRRRGASRSAGRASTSRSSAPRSAARRSSTTAPHYDIPYSGDDATGLGKPLKLILKPLRRDVPIYLAAIGPKNVALAAEIADGWLPIFFSPYRFREIHGPSLEGAPDGLPDRADVPRARRRRRAAVPRHAEADARALHRRHGRARQELLQLAHAALRLRGGRGEDPGALPLRDEGRGGDDGAGRARRRDRARRAEGADRRAARGLARGRDLDARRSRRASRRRSR